MLRTRRARQALTQMGVFLLGLVFSCLMLLVPGPTSATVPAEPPLPMTAMEANGQYARIPDWSKITFHTLPPILSDGEFIAPSELNQTVDYDLSRRWQAGQTADTYLKLGDFQTTLYPQILNLDTIAQATQLNLDRVALSAFEMAAWQTIADWVTALPGLGNYPLREVPPIAALIQGSIDAKTLKNSAEGRIGEILHTHPELEPLRLGQLGEQLNQFAITDIPGLQQVPLQNLAGWKNSSIAGVPGLANLSFSQMPNPIQLAGMLARVDVIYGPAERDRRNTISGSHETGFQVPCQENCAYAELAGAALLYGKQWISGKYQMVKGGFGVLGAVNGGKEPTGRHPFGDVFKVSIWDVDEASGTLSTVLHFRICQRGLPDLGCTPYFLGPIPFLNYREKELIFTGLLDGQGGASSPASIPEGVIERAKAMGIPAAALPGYEPSDLESGAGNLCGEGPGGVNFKALAVAFSTIEGNYHSVGSFVCDGDGHCGRGLGRYQYMSYRADVRADIQRQSGGAAFLAKVDSGAAVNSAEVERFLPASRQDHLFKADQTRNIQQALQEGFSGRRLVERVGQIHFGGAAAPIDGGASDIHGRLTLKTYGEELADQYQQAVPAVGAPSCRTGRGARAQIAQAAQQMQGMDTSAGPDGGNLACAWAVNRVLERSIGRTIGSNPNYVPSVEEALRGGAGTQVELSQAAAGDIVIASNESHIGICQNSGCTRVLSNSSSRASFSWESNTNFDGYYGGGSSRIYRVNHASS